MAPPNIKIIPIALEEPSVQELVLKLDTYQVALYGLANCNLESLEQLKRSPGVLMGAYDNGKLVGIGAIRIREDYAEVKRMYVDLMYRRCGIAYSILSALENVALRQNTKQIFIETGRLQTNAIRLYKRAGYKTVTKFADHVPNDISVYFGKEI